VSALAQRLIGTLGVAYVVITIAPAFFLPSPPPGGATATEVARFYTDHRDALLVSGWVGLLAFPLGFVFVAGLGLLLRGEGQVSLWLLTAAFLSISVTLAVAAVQGILALAVPYVSRSIPGDQLKVLADITQLGFSAAFALEIAYFVATGALVLRSRALPGWLGYGAFIVSVIAVLASLGVVVGSGPLAAGGPISLLSLVAGLLWWLLAAILLVVRPGVAP